MRETSLEANPISRAARTRVSHPRGSTPMGADPVNSKSQVVCLTSH